MLVVVTRDVFSLLQCTAALSCWHSDSRDLFNFRLWVAPEFLPLAPGCSRCSSTKPTCESDDGCFELGRVSMDDIGGGRLACVRLWWRSSGRERILRRRRVWHDKASVGGTDRTQELFWRTAMRDLCRQRDQVVAESQRGGGPTTATESLAPRHDKPPQTGSLARHFTSSTVVQRLLTARRAFLLLTRCRGKVHGSLARAGKVKSQTPKVEPQEKKKKVCLHCERVELSVNWTLIGCEL